MYDLERDHQHTSTIVVCLWEYGRHQPSAAGVDDRYIGSVGTTVA